MARTDLIIKSLQMELNAERGLRHIAETRADNYRREYLTLVSQISAIRRELESATVATEDTLSGG